MDETIIKHRILIVEDDPKLASVIESTLRFAGLQTQVVHNGADAIKAAREDPSDVILLDMMLPNMSGLVVCQTLKNDLVAGSGYMHIQKTRTLCLKSVTMAQV